LFDNVVVIDQIIRLWLPLPNCDSP